MKKIISYCIVLLLWKAVAMAQQPFPIDTVLYSGPIEKRITFVILGDGYQEHEFAKFRTDVRTITDYMFSTPPLQQYKSYFNVFAVPVASQQSGALHPGTASDEPPFGWHPVLNVNTYFGSTFDYAGIHRLLVPTNTQNIAMVLANSIPDYDQAFVLVNSGFYGGSGGAIATASTDFLSAGVAYHEIGHSFVGLGDEYSISSSFGEGRNVSSTTERFSLPWQQWLNDTVPLPTPRTSSYANVVGAFPRSNDGSGNNGYISTQNCKMQYVTSDFCVVCREHFIERIHDLSTPIDGITPTTTDIQLTPDETRTFALQLVHPIPSTLQTEWTLDGTAIAHNTDSLRLAMTSLTAGQHVLSAVISDTTLHSRSTQHVSQHSYLVEWHINRLATSVKIDAEQTTFTLHTTPNPFAENLTMRYRLSRSARVRIELLDLHGKLSGVLLEQQQLDGEHTYSTPFHHGNLASGTYIVRALLDGIPVSYHVVLHQ